MTKDVLAKILFKLEKAGVKTGDKLLLAVSGGVDSVVLTHLVVKLAESQRYKFALFHLDHSLRAEASVADYQLVETLAAELACPFYGYKRDVRCIAKNRKQNMEQTAREIRYQLANEVLTSEGYDYLLTAHHLGDQAETIMLNLIRGTSLNGLRGIALAREQLIRPLLDFSKPELYQIAERNSWLYNEDATNDDLSYSRNRLRHRIIPMIEEHYNPRFQHALAQMATIIASDDDYLENIAEKQLEQISSFTGKQMVVDLSAWQDIDLSLRRRIIRLIFLKFNGDMRNLSFEHIEIIDQWLIEGRIATRQYFSSLEFILQKASVLIRIRETNTIFEPLKIGLGEHYISKDNLLITVSKKIQPNSDIYLPVSLFAEGLYLRRRLAGDYIRPLGMGTKRKSLKKFLNEQKVALAERANIPLLAIKEEVIWVKDLRKSIYASDKIQSDEIIYITIQSGVEKCARHLSSGVE